MTIRVSDWTERSQREAVRAGGEFTLGATGVVVD